MRPLRQPLNEPPSRCTILCTAAIWYKTERNKYRNILLNNQALNRYDVDNLSSVLARTVIRKIKQDAPHYGRSAYACDWGIRHSDLRPYELVLDCATHFCGGRFPCDLRYARRK